MQRVVLDVSPGSWDEPVSEEDVPGLTEATLKLVGQQLNAWGVSWQLAGRSGPDPEVWVYLPEEEAPRFRNWWLTEGQQAAADRYGGRDS